MSKPTLFAYFATKEDMALHRLVDHDTEAAGVVDSRDPDTDALAALHDHFRTGLCERDPVTGLNDDPDVRAYHRLVMSTPGLVGRMALYNARQDTSLTDALARTWRVPRDDLAATLVARQVLSAHLVLALRNVAAIESGTRADDRVPVAVAELDTAHEAIRGGIGPDSNRQPTTPATASPSIRG